LYGRRIGSWSGWDESVLIRELWEFYVEDKALWIYQVVLITQFDYEGIPIDNLDRTYA